MRLGFVTLFLLSGMAVAGERPATPPSAVTVHAAPIVDLKQPPGATRKFILPPRSWKGLGPTCLVLDTYRVRRESPDSDATRLVGRTHCTPSTKFRFRPAIPSEPAATDRPKD